MTTIRPCDCFHKVQDKLYGLLNRVMNEKKKDGKAKGWCCTVCGRSRE